MKKVLLLATCTLLLQGCPSSPVEPVVGTIQGTVTIDDQPAAGIEVWLDRTVGGFEIMSDITDGEGRYTFNSVVTGTHQVEVLRPPENVEFSAILQSGTIEHRGHSITIDFEGSTRPPTGSEIEGGYALQGTIRQNENGCGTDDTISNPGPIEVVYLDTPNTIIIRSDADVEGPYTPGDPWTGTGAVSNVQETVTGMWQFSDETIILLGVLTFQFESGGSVLCSSSYDVTYTRLSSD